MEINSIVSFSKSHDCTSEGKIERKKPVKVQGTTQSKQTFIKKKLTASWLERPLSWLERIRIGS